MNTKELTEILKQHELWLKDSSLGKRANLIEADLTGDNLSEANLSGAYLSEANLSGANLSGANLSGANLLEAYLTGANLSEANLSGDNLSGAYLSGANLSGANLSGANLSGANLSGANLLGANLLGATLLGANLNHLIGQEIYNCYFGQHNAVYVKQTGIVTIGCQEHTIEYWLENYEKIGEEAEYTKTQIVLYGDWLKSIAKHI